MPLLRLGSSKHEEPPVYSIVLKPMLPQGQASAQRAASAAQANFVPTAAIPPQAAAVGSVTTTVVRVVTAHSAEGQPMSLRRAHVQCAPRALLAEHVPIVVACRQASASSLGGTSRSGTGLLASVHNCIMVK